LKNIPLNQGKYETIVSDEDYEFLMQWKWKLCNKYAARKEHLGYDINHKRLSRTIYMHRVVMNTQDNLETDHINGNKLDNQRCNLRVVTSSQNKMNRGVIRGLSKFKGVSWNKASSTWVANLVKDKKNIFLGYFTCELLAAAAYNAACKKYHGEFAKLNEVA